MSIEEARIEADRLLGMTDIELLAATIECGKERQKIKKAIKDLE